MLYRNFMGGTTGPRLRGRPQSEQVNRRLLAAAFELVAEVGQEAMSISEVARRAGTTMPAVYRRYRDKEALLTAVVDREMKAIESEPADTGSLRGDLIESVRSIVAALTPTHARVLAGLVLADDAHRAPSQRLSDALRRTTDDTFARVIDRGVLRGELRSTRAPELLTRVPGAIVMNMALLGDGPLSEDQIIGLVDQIMLPALTGTANE
ncbi:TetR/AcrR family transcriptional regulator [Actinomyces israelii]